MVEFDLTTALAVGKLITHFYRRQVRGRVARCQIGAVNFEPIARTDLIGWGRKQRFVPKLCVGAKPYAVPQGSPRPKPANVG